jgi:zinc protease
MNLREANGYTYGARSQFSFMKDNGTFSASSQVRADVTTPAIQEILKEIERMTTSRVTADELVAAKEGIIRALPSGFESSDGIVGSTATLFVNGLPLNYFSTMSERFGAVTAEDVERVAKAYLRPDTMLIVAVGDLSKIRGPLEAAFGRADIRDAEGNPVSPF